MSIFAATGLTGPLTVLIGLLPRENRVGPLSASPESMEYAGIELFIRLRRV